MYAQKFDLDKQKEIFLGHVLKNKNIVEILDNGFVAGRDNWYLVAGCINQTVWNSITSKDIEQNIGDYDLIYFDEDTSYEAEDIIIKEVTEKYSHLNISLDIKNQARVHLWIESKFGLSIRPLISCEDAIASWPNTSTCIGIRKNKAGEYIIMAPYGLTDMLEMVLRPNKVTVMRESDYYYKANKWKQTWPELTLLPW